MASQYSDIPVKTSEILGLCPNRLETNPGLWYATDPRATQKKIITNRGEGSYLGRWQLFFGVGRRQHALLSQNCSALHLTPGDTRRRVSPGVGRVPALEKIFRELKIPDLIPDAS